MRGRSRGCSCSVSHPRGGARAAIERPGCSRGRSSCQHARCLTSGRPGLASGDRSGGRAVPVSRSELPSSAAWWTIPSHAPGREASAPPTASGAAAPTGASCPRPGTRSGAGGGQCAFSGTRAPSEATRVRLVPHNGAPLPGRSADGPAGPPLSSVHAVLRTSESVKLRSTGADGRYAQRSRRGG